MSVDESANYEAAIALREKGQYAAALDMLQAFSKQFPYHHQTWLTIGFIHGQLSQFESSIEAFDRALELDPANEQAMTYRELACIGFAQNLAHDGKWQAALDQFETIVERNPTQVQAHFDRGRVLKLLKRYHLAMRAFEHVNTLDSTHIESYLERADILQYHGFFEPARANFETAMALGSKSGLGYRGLANVQKAFKSHSLALSLTEKAIAVEPDNPANHDLRREILLDMRKQDVLLEESLQAIVDTPKNPLALARHAHLVSLLCQFDLALIFYNRALEIDPTCLSAKHGKSGVLYALGQWRASYALCSAAERSSNLLVLKGFAKPIWDGTQSLQGKHLLIYFELGLGDAIMHVRFAVHLAQQSAHQGVKITLQVPRGLIRLFSNLGSIAQVISLEEASPDCDYVCSQLSLAAALQIESDSVPYANQPYVQVAPAWREAWQTRIDQLPQNNLRVGLVWSGGYAAYDFRRSFDLTQFLPFLQIKGIDFFSFQKRSPSQDHESLESKHGLLDYTEHIHDFADTAVLMEQMDLLIGCDTSVLHLAGAMGKPAWMLCRFDGPWWADNVAPYSSSPWYQTLRFYRQKTLGVWDDVVDRVAIDLKKFMKPSEIIATKANEQAQAVFEQGRIALQNGDHPLAIKQFEAALSVYPQNYDATHFLGIALAQTGQPQRAVSYFKQALKLLPNSISAHNNLGLALDELQDYEAAIASFDRALALAPDYEQAKFNRQATLARLQATSNDRTA
jgi:tetratricopeptide (TPR) repeat protein